MTISSPRRLPWRVLVPIRLPDQRSTRTAEFVAHRRRALALPLLSPHVAGDAAGPAAQFRPSRAPLATGAPVQRLGALVEGLAVLVLQENRMLHKRKSDI